MVYKEFTADQVLALAFIAYGKDSLVGYQEFDNVFDALRSELHKNNFPNHLLIFYLPLYHSYLNYLSPHITFSIICNHYIFNFIFHIFPSFL